MSAPDLSRHRPNVGVVLFNREGLAWYGLRAGFADAWQFPQGGVDPGEGLETAARRELFEETGVVSVAPLGRTEGWIAYDFPPGYGGAKQARAFRGQKQAWFAYRFTGGEDEIDLAAHGEVEFDAWRWAPLADAPGLIVRFKRPAYEAVVAAFGRFAA